MSQTKSESARANGAKSKGPATPASRARSSKNALRHGLASQAVLLPGEKPAEFEELRAGYLQRFQPADRPEMELVETLALTRWRLRRLYTIEAEILDNEMHILDGQIESDFGPNAGPRCRLAWTFEYLSNNRKSPAMLLRYEAHLTRTYDRARKELELLQKNRPASPPADAPPPDPPAAAQSKLQNEPKRPNPGNGPGLRLVPSPTEPASEPRSNPNPALDLLRKTPA